MCGIYLTTGRQIKHDVPSWLYNRGPDFADSIRTDQGVCLSASVLQMRQTFVPQPVMVSPSVHLAWNGEVYQLVNRKGEIDDVYRDDCPDTQLIANLLLSDQAKEINHSSVAITMGRLFNAEFAFCIVTTKYIFYGRDIFGRRSLLKSKNDHLQIASVAQPEGDWVEIEPGQVFCYGLSTQNTTSLSFLLPKMILPVIKCSILTKRNDHDGSLPRNISPSMDQASRQLQQLLLEAVHRRVSQGKTAVLFSGGVDSVVIAAMALEFLDEITLVNVSFVDDPNNEENPIPADTLAAQVSYLEITQLYPDKNIKFVQQQVCWSEIEMHEARIRGLIHPKGSIMDLNIATALWFAARCCSSTRILLSGLGADEQMGGYGRHRQACNDLRQELAFDLGRLWTRNLGRDDRVLSDASQEARFPFLDPNVVQFLQQQSPEDLCDYSLPPGEGDKRVLRIVAARMGLQSASRAVKRAIQFGSRISQVSDPKRAGSRRQATRKATR